MDFIVFMSVVSCLLLAVSFIFSLYARREFRAAIRESEEQHARHDAWWASYNEAVDRETKRLVRIWDGFDPKDKLPEEGQEVLVAWGNPAIRGEPYYEVVERLNGKWVSCSETRHDDDAWVISESAVVRWWALPKPPKQEGR